MDSKRYEFWRRWIPWSKKELDRIEDLRRRGLIRYTLDRGSDLFFKAVFAHPDRVLLLLDLINAVFAALGMPLIVSIIHINIEIPPGARGQKDVIADIRAIDETGRHIIIEMQREISGDSVKTRFLFYWARDYTSQLQSGEDHKDLKATVLIVFAGGNMWPGENAFHHIAALDVKTHEVLTDDLAMIFIEMKKLESKVDALYERCMSDETYRPAADERINVWSGYFMNSEKGVALVDMLAQRGDANFAQLLKIEKEYWSDPKYRYAQMALEARELGRSQMMNDAEQRGLIKGKREGLIEGERKGERKKALRMARNMLAQGFAPEDIAKVAELPLSDVTALIDSPE
jgi:hypothetical protein